MKSFYIVTNTTKDPDLVYTNSILDYLNKHNVSCIYNPDSADVEHTDYCYTNADIVPDDTECIIVLGGDGTLIQAAVRWLCRLRQSLFLSAPVGRAPAANRSPGRTARSGRTGPGTSALPPGTPLPQHLPAVS